MAYTRNIYPVDTPCTRDTCRILTSIILTEWTCRHNLSCLHFSHQDKVKQFNQIWKLCQLSKYSACIWLQNFVGKIWNMILITINSGGIKSNLSVKIVVELIIIMSQAESSKVHPHLWCIINLVNFVVGKKKGTNLVSFPTSSTFPYPFNFSWTPLNGILSELFFSPNVTNTQQKKSLKKFTAE